jgi:hypothetical protein
MRFEKPVYIQEINDSGSILPADVQLLYGQIGLAIDKESVIPCEVRE